MEITCPTGLRGVIRKFKVADEALLTDSRLANTGRLLTALAKALWIETLQPGPYRPGPINWGEVATSDRLHVLMQARMLTHGANIEFERRCPTSGCNETIQATADLSALACRPVAPEIIAGLSTGAWPTYPLTDGREVTYRCLLGKDDPIIESTRRKTPQLLSHVTLARRVIGITGVGDHFAEIETALRNLDLDEAALIREAFDRAEGGYDLDMRLTCTRCDTSWDETIPFDLTFFTGPKRSSPRTAATTRPAVTTTAPGGTG